MTSAPRTSESQLLREILAVLGARPDVRLFRNSVGFGRTTAGMPVHFGLCVGSSDLIGIVAPHGRLLALEVKSAIGAATTQQLAFLAMVRAMGGVGRIVRSVDEAVRAADEAGQ